MNHAVVGLDCCGNWYWVHGVSPNNSLNWMPHHSCGVCGARAAPVNSGVRAHRRMLSFLKKLALVLGKALLALGLVFAIFAAYGFYAERAAVKKATEMCASISPGSNPSALRTLAIADGASDFQTRWGKLNGLDTLFITYVGLPPFSRHICLVTSKDGRVISARLSYLD